MKIKLLLLFFFPLISFAQKEWSVYGTILNFENQRPLSGITITNIRTGRIVVSNEKGDFYTRAAEGDSIIASGIGFAPLKVQWDRSLGKLRFGLQQTAISLEEVVVKDKRNETLEREIKNFLDHPENGATLKKNIMGDIISMSGSGGLGAGAGISIDALYELWSKEGKTRRKAADLEYQEIKDMYLDLRFNARKVAHITGLEGEELERFMQFCKPGEDFILKATDYELTYQIFQCKKDFQAQSSPILRKRN